MLPVEHLTNFAVDQSREQFHEAEEFTPHLFALSIGDNELCAADIPVEAFTEELVGRVVATHTVPQILEDFQAHVCAITRRVLLCEPLLHFESPNAAPHKHLEALIIQTSSPRATTSLALLIEDDGTLGDPVPVPTPTDKWLWPLVGQLRKNVAHYN